MPFLAAIFGFQKDLKIQKLANQPKPELIEMQNRVAPDALSSDKGYFVICHEGY